MVLLFLCLLGRRELAVSRFSPSRTGLNAAERLSKTTSKNAPPRPHSDQADRDAIASELLRYRDGRGDDWADIIDMLTVHPETRRRVVRMLAEIDAIDTRQ
jgi:hypothetical protein